MLWYLRLESVKARYTKALCEEWMPSAFEARNVPYTTIEGDNVSDDISVGSVLDATARTTYSLSQVKNLILRISEIEDGDIIYLQDFFTVGIEGLFYALHQNNLKVRVYAMQHAGCHDMHDFTHSMRSWMAGYEAMVSSYLAGVFVASSCHKEILKVAGYSCPIHVVSLPFSQAHSAQMHLNSASNNVGKTNNLSNVIYTSRLDKEKNPLFMLEVAQEWLAENDQHSWTLTTSGDSFKAAPEVLDRIEYLKESYPKRFTAWAGLSKQEYFDELTKAGIQFNAALQDFVSWTLLEATACRCIPVYPNYRSFPEILPPACLYKPSDVKGAITSLLDAKKFGEVQSGLCILSDKGRMWVVDIMTDNLTEEINIWHRL